MATAAGAAREFVNGPQVLQAAHLLLERYPVAALCQALADAQGEDADALLGALEKLSEFEEVRGALLTEELAGFLRLGTTAPDPRARRLVARLLLQLAKAGEGGVGWLAGAGLLDACEALLLDPETGTAETVAGLLRACCEWPEGRRVLLSAEGGVVGRLQGRLQGLGDTERIRVLHLFVELGRVSDEVFATLAGTGAYKSVLGAFFTDDLLLKLNAVELMDALGSYPRGQVLLSQEGVPQHLAQELVDPMCDSSIRLCVVRLLGFVLLRTPEAAGVLLPGREAPFPQVVAAMLGGRDPGERLIALSAWASAACHHAGLAFWLGWPELLQLVLSQVSSPQNEVCKGAMAAWADALRGRPPPPPAPGSGGEDASPEVALWRLAEQSLVPLVLKALIGKPFPDVRSHCWLLLAELARSRTAAQRVIPSEEIRDLLLDFTSETNSEARIAKHEFVVSLVGHQGNWLGAFLDETVEQLLEEYSRQGPHWVPRNSAVLVGDQSNA